MARGEKIDDESLKALISDEIRSAVTYDETELSEKRGRAMEYYQGIMKDTPSLQGRSTFVSMDIADTIGWMLPGIVRVFTASDRMAEYEPTEPGDEEAAQQATDYCNFIFWKDNHGYRILWDATHDSLLQADGIVKHWWDDKEECSYSEHSGLTEEQVALLTQDEGDIEIVAQKPGEPQRITVPDETTGQPVEQEIQTYDIKLKRVTRRGRVRVECIKPEDFLIDRSAITVENARFLAHRDEKSRSDLIEMGFDRELVMGLPAFSYSTLSEEKLAREDEYRSYNDVGHESTHVVELYECYIKADADGDGISETIRAYYVGEPSGGELLDWEVWDDDVPFSDIPCEPVPHRWESRSVADETIDLQRVKTVLTRQMLDNLYASNLPQREVEQDSVINPEALANPQFGGMIIRKKGSQPIVPHAIPFVADKVLTALQHFDDVREMRTGVARSTMALDPQALTNQTATADQNQRDASYSQIELIARNQAELGWRRVFRQILKLVIKHQDRPRTIRLRDEWVEMDPRHWNADMDCTINVGLGTGSRDRDMSMLKTILETQIALTDRLAGGGFMDKALDMMPRIRNTLVKLAESAGLKNPEMYYPEIDEQTVEQMKQQASEQASQPDPKVQMEQAKLEADMQRGQAEMQMDAAKNQQDAELQRQKMEADIILQREKMQLEFQAKTAQMEAEFALKQWQISQELAMKRELSAQEMEMKREQGFYSADAQAEVGKYKADASSKVNMGGNPG